MLFGVNSFVLSRVVGMEYDFGNVKRLCVGTSWCFPLCKRQNKYYTAEDRPTVGVAVTAHTGV